MGMVDEINEYFADENEEMGPASLTPEHAERLKIVKEAKLAKKRSSGGASRFDDSLTPREMDGILPIGANAPVKAPVKARETPPKQARPSRPTRDAELDAIGDILRQVKALGPSARIYVASRLRTH